MLHTHVGGSPGTAWKVLQHWRKPELWCLSLLCPRARKAALSCLPKREALVPQKSGKWGWEGAFARVVRRGCL